MLSIDNNMKELNERELKELGYRVKAGEAGAFHVLYRRFFARYVQYATRYTYDQEEAADLVQNAFFSLWEHLEQYDEQRNIFLYLLVIVKNNCLGYLRGMQIKDRHGDKIIEAMLFSDMPEAEVDEDVRGRLREVLEELPEKGRCVLLQHVVEGKKVKDIAAEMNVAESTVKTHLKRSLKFLRERLSLILFAG